jgi:hypothetical protein
MVYPIQYNFVIIKEMKEKGESLVNLESWILSKRGELQVTVDKKGNETILKIWDSKFKERFRISIMECADFLMVQYFYSGRKECMRYRASEMCLELKAFIIKNINQYPKFRLKCLMNPDDIVHCGNIIDKPEKAAKEYSFWKTIKERMGDASPKIILPSLVPGHLYNMMKKEIGIDMNNKFANFIVLLVSYISIIGFLLMLIMLTWSLKDKIQDEIPHYKGIRQYLKFRR